MERTIDVAFRYQDVRDSSGLAIAVIDTLRATTTMTVILDHGALAVRPVGDLEEAYAIKRKDSHVLLGGERENRPPEGFDGGNSPFDWPALRVRGQRVIFTTTNGTQAIERSRAADRLILASLINAKAAANFLLELERPALIVASGTRGQLAFEDVLAAGALVSYWPQDTWSDAAKVAAALYFQYRRNLNEAIKESQHGRDLVSLGLSPDIERAAELNETRVVPILCGDGWLRAID